METKSTFLQLKTSEREHRRDLILDAAVQLFAQKPFADIGMRDIAKKAGISPASIYRYFPSRDAILMEVLGQEIHQGRIKQRQRLQQSNLDLEEVALGMVDFFLDKDSTLHLLSHFLLKEDIDSKTLHKFQEARDYYLNHFDHIMICSGVPAKGVRLMSHAFFSSILGHILVFHAQPGQSKEESKEYLYRLSRLTASIFSKGMS